MPNYYINQAISSLQNALVEIEKISAEVGKIEDIKEIQVLHKRVKSFYEDNKQYNRADVERIFGEMMAYRDEILNEINRIHEENLPKIENNKRVLQKVKDFMSFVGIPEKHRYQKKFGGKVYEEPAGYLLDLQRLCLTNDNYNSAHKSVVDGFTKEAERWKKEELFKIEKRERKKKEDDFKLRQLATAISLSEKYKISAGTTEELIRLVTDRAIEEFKRENKLEGDAVICGNIVDGFYRFEGDDEEIYY